MFIYSYIIQENDCFQPTFKAMCRFKPFSIDKKMAPALWQTPAVF